MGNISYNQIYIPYDNNHLIGGGLGVSVINKNNFIFSFKTSFYYNSMKHITRYNGLEARYYTNFKYIFIPNSATYNVDNIITHFNFLIGYSTDIDKKVSVSLQSGPSVLYPYPGFLQIIYNIDTNNQPVILYNSSKVLWNFLMTLRWKATPQLNVYNCISYRDFRYTSVQYALGIEYHLSKNKNPTYDVSNDVNKKRNLQWYVGLGTSINKTVFKHIESIPYYDSIKYKSPVGINQNGIDTVMFDKYIPDNPSALLYYQTLDVLLDVHLKWFFARNLTKIFIGNYSSIYSIKGNTKIWNNVFVGISNHYKRKKFFYLVGFGSYHPENFYYEIKATPAPIIIRDYTRFIRSSFIELGYNLNKWISVSMYLGRVGSEDRLQNEGANGTANFYFPSLYTTYVGINFSYQINL
ncbi:MAG: hypothetical protein Fur0023_10720 [Bacteroidia bacterium]